MQLILIILILLAPIFSNAKSILEKKYNTSSGEVFVRLHIESHDSLRPYVLEIYPSCGVRASKENFKKKLQILDVASMCYINAKSIKYDSRNNEIFFDAFDLDTKKMSEQSMIDPLAVKPICSIARKVKLSLNNICRD